MKSIILEIFSDHFDCIVFSNWNNTCAAGLLGCVAGGPDKMSSVQSVIHCQHGSGQTAILLSIIVTAIIYSNSIHIINTIHIVGREYNLGGENLWYVTKYVSCSLKYLWCFWTNFNFLLSLATEYILFLILEQIELNFPLCSQPYSQIKYIRYPPWGIFIRLCLFIFIWDTWALLL